MESDFMLNYEKLYSLSAHFVKHWVIGRNNHSVEEKHLLLMIEASASYYSWVNGEFSYKRTLNFTRTIKWLSEKNNNCTLVNVVDNNASLSGTCVKLIKIKDCALSELTFTCLIF